jgi:hypothetical protein
MQIFEELKTITATYNERVLIHIVLGQKGVGR